MFSIYGSLIVLAFCNSIALDNIGWYYYLVFVGILVIVNIVSWLFFPETKGFSLEEVAEIFDGINIHADAEAAAHHDGKDRVSGEIVEDVKPTLNKRL